MHFKTALLGLAFLVVSGLSAASVQADIYVYIDQNGVAHFTNVPNSAKYRLFMSAPPLNTYNTSKYDAFITEAAKKYGVSFPLVKAIIKAESGFNPRAVSKKGAQGLMQLMPSTASLLNVKNPFDPWENINGGTRYFKNLLDRFNGKLALALAGYNAGPEKVARYRGVPPYRETQDYIRKVIRYYRMLKDEG